MVYFVEYYEPLQSVWILVKSSLSAKEAKKWGKKNRPNNNEWRVINTFGDIIFTHHATTKQ